ncbi:hypothetical protein [Krasilnikovia sp. MM14-A1259]|uniref:hypothetical protein n=1 Tax=Krasilnikovia sp. MM14-A1259 TaxID=3373539 RepID=UPI003830B390
MDDIVFTYPWRDLRSADPADVAQREALAAELAVEVSPGHPLHGKPAIVTAKSEVTDDIVVRLADRSWAVVHLTWRGSAENPPWPSTDHCETPEALATELADRT